MGVRGPRPDLAAPRGAVDSASVASVAGSWEAGRGGAKEEVHGDAKYARTAHTLPLSWAPGRHGVGGCARPAES
eukprot:9481172-Pyramimonas_sp.AAC.1